MVAETTFISSYIGVVFFSLVSGLGLICFYHPFSLPEKCPSTEFFLVRIFPHSDWIQENNIPNTGKYGLEKTPYFDTFYSVLVQEFVFNFDLHNGSKIQKLKFDMNYEFFPEIDLKERC